MAQTELGWWQRGWSAFAAWSRKIFKRSPRFLVALCIFEKWENFFLNSSFKNQKQRKPTFTAASVEAVHIVVSSYRPVLALPLSCAMIRTDICIYSIYILNVIYIIYYVYGPVLALPPSCAAMGTFYLFVC